MRGIDDAFLLLQVPIEGAKQSMATPQSIIPRPVFLTRNR